MRREGGGILLKIRTASRSAGGGGKEKHRLEKQKKKENKIKEGFRKWHLIVLCSPCFLRLGRKQWVDVTTPWGLHINDAHQHSGRVLTQTWCAWQRLQRETRAAHGENRRKGKRVFRHLYSWELHPVEIQAWWSAFDLAYTLYKTVYIAHKRRMVTITVEIH